MTSPLLTKKEKSIIEKFNSNKQKLEKDLIEYFYNQCINNIDEDSLLNNDYKCTKITYNNSYVDYEFVGSCHEINIELKYKNNVITFKYDYGSSDNGSSTDTKIMFNKNIIYQNHEMSGDNINEYDSSDIDSELGTENKIFDKDEVAVLVNFFSKIQSIF